MVVTSSEPCSTSEIPRNCWATSPTSLHQVVDLSSASRTGTPVFSQGHPTRCPRPSFRTGSTDGTATPRLAQILPTLLVQAGLKLGLVRCEFIRYHKLSDAEAAFPLRRAAAQADTDGHIAAADASSWIADLERASSEGRFLFAVPMINVVATRATHP
jgi:hypothetical protein